MLGEHDKDTPLYMVQTLFPLRLNAPSRRMVVLGDALHVVLSEKNRMQLFFDEGR